MKNAKQTALAKRAVLEALEKTLGVVTQACKLAKVSRSEFYLWKQKDEDFKKAVDDVSDIVLDFAESALHKQINEGNTTATIFLLKTKGKSRGYIEKQEFEHSGEISGTPIIQFGDTSKKDDQ